MAFHVHGQENRESTNVGFDYEAYNKYMVETCGLENEETLPGYISALIDLGIQEQPDAEVVFTGDEDDEAEIQAEFPDTYFKNGTDDKGKTVRLKCWPQKPVPCVVLAVDFPDILVDKGQFFGEPGVEKPLRLYLGGQFWNSSRKQMEVGSSFPLRVNKKLGAWSLATNSTLYKMAKDAGLVKEGEAFPPSKIDELLGQAFQFKAQVYFRESKGKEYYTETVKYAAKLARGMAEPEQLTKPVLIQFGEDNPIEEVAEIRAHVINTIKNASNFEGSKLKDQLEEVAANRAAKAKDAPKAAEADDQEEDDRVVTPKAQRAKPAAKAEKPKSTERPSDIDNFDDDIPW